MDPDLVAFADELAAMQKEAARQEEKAEREAKALAGAAISAAGLAGGIGLIGLKEALHKSLAAAPRSVLGPIDSLAAKMGIEAPVRAIGPPGDNRFGYLYPSDVKGKRLQELIRQGRPAEEIARAKRVGMVVGPVLEPSGAVAHEVGHAVNNAKNKILTALARTGRLIGGPTVGAVVGGVMSAAPEDAESWVVKAAPALPILFHAPVLADEALASVRAVKGMKSLGTYSPKVLKKAKGNLVKAFGTYLLQAAALSTPIAALSVGRVIEGRRKKKTASASAAGRILPSLFARAYKDDEEFRKAVNKKVKDTLSTDPNRIRWRR